MSNSHVVVDALQDTNVNRERLEQWRAGGIGCVHVTLSIWEDARATLDLLGKWNRLAREFPHLIALARSTTEIREIAASGRTAVVLGSQNGSLFDDDLDLVEVFHSAGVRIVQLTYNIQNLIGASCYDPADAGVTRFGKYVIGEMNRVGMLVDLSHVGPKTTMDAIEISTSPVAVTHANPASVWDHVRNKSDEILKALAQRGGVLGVAPYPHLTGGKAVGQREWSEMVARAVDIMGIGHVGIGSDSCHGWGDDRLQWIRSGRWSHERQLGPATKGQEGWLPWPEFFGSPAEFPALLDGLRDVGFDEDEVAKISGDNWMRVFGEVFD